MELESKISVNTENMEICDDSNNEQQTIDPCCSNDRVMCKVIDEMLLSNGLL